MIAMRCRVVIAATIIAALFCGVNTEAKPQIGGKGKMLQIEENKLICTFSTTGSKLSVQKLVNHNTGFNWAVPDSTAGIYLAQGESTISGFDGHGNLSPTRQKADHAYEWLTQWKRKDGLDIDWTIRTLPGVSAMEFDAKLKNASSKTIKNLNSFGPLALQLKEDTGSLRLHWLNRADYRMHQADFTDDFSLSGGSWNAPDAAGWLAIENTAKKEILFVGIQWESYWRINLHKQNGQIQLSCCLDGFQRDIQPGETIDSPRVFLGLSNGDLDDSLRDFHDYLRKYVFPPSLKDFPWVTYDIWGTEASGVEEGIISEIPIAKSLGVELFYVDASWYEGSAKNGSGDWFTGVGNWQKEDTAKYPNGLANISKKVHEAGMKFGLWFDPQVVDSSLVGGLIPDAWVAKSDGSNVSLDLNNGWSPITQICLGDPAVVEHLKSVLSDAIERYNLDWLKWDNSGLPGAVCNRSDHGHRAGDGALAALRGEYEIYDYLHKKYPNLVLENCGYPSRLDYRLARCARANWLSDDTSDALKCRQSQIHGSAAFPASHNTAWVVKSAEIADQKDHDILDTVVRSRMIGLFGMGTLNGKLEERASLYSPEVKDALKRNIANYKRYRHLLKEDVYHLLPPSTSKDQWDAIEFCKRDGSEAVLIAFRSGSSENKKILKLRGINQSLTYNLTSLNTSKVQQIPGSKLMSEGLEILLPKVDTSEIYLIK